ncbi:C40 family peptidase [Salegentibacter sp. HM20]
MKKHRLKNTGKIIFLILLFSAVGYITYFDTEEAEVKPEKAMPQSTVEPKETDSEMTTVASKPGLRDSLVDFSEDLLGTPYVTAGNGIEGFDCSGYVYYVYQYFDIEVPRSTSGYEDFGQEIPIAEVEKGDLLLFLSPTRNAIGHIGIVTKANGTASEFIHASSGNSMEVITTSLSSPTYIRRFVKAVRVLQDL